MFQLPLVIFIVLITIPFLGSYAPELYAGPCEESCKTDCQGITGQERGGCIRQCLGGRCDNHGVQTAAQMLGNAGIDCSADGQCNAFCDATPDPDCVYIPPGHAGIAVKFYVNGTIIDFLEYELITYGGGTATQALDGTVTLTAPFYTGGDIFGYASAQHDITTPVSAGTSIDFNVIQAQDVAHPAQAVCWYVTLDSYSSLGTTPIEGPSALGHHVVVVSQDEPSGVKVLCVVQITGI